MSTQLNAYLIGAIFNIGHERCVVTKTDSELESVVHFKYQHDGTEGCMLADFVKANLTKAEPVS
jgi:hypothetical protein